MERGIDRALGDGMATEPLQLAGQHTGELDAAGGNPKQHQGAAVLHRLQDLRGKPCQGPPQLPLGKNLDPFVVGRGRHETVTLW